MKKIGIVIVILLGILAIFFYPKVRDNSAYNGGAIYKCLGFETSQRHIEGSVMTCYGILYSTPYQDAPNR